ncbi:MAG: hypothetical protein Q9212_005036 [Teloschistes hypoglaucus]
MIYSHQADPTRRDPIVTPGGMIPPPTFSPIPLYDVTIRPRMSSYLDGETSGSFIISAHVGLAAYYKSFNLFLILVVKLSYSHGEPWDYDTSSHKPTNETVENGELVLRVFHSDSGVDIIPSSPIHFIFSDKDFPFALAGISGPALAPISVTMEVKRRSNGKIYKANTELYYLPVLERPQSIARLDTLYGGLHVKRDESEWEAVFPYSFYLDGAWLASNPDHLKQFSNMGYNILHIVPGGQGIGYNLHQLDLWFDEAEKLGLWIMFDMRWTYQNNDYVRIQVERYRRRKNMLLWYTADEPGESPQAPSPPALIQSDGHENSRSAPSKAYAFIKSLDPYHPISLCLNCENYYFESYSSGADIVLADVYPIGTNLLYSNKYHTPCNETYGDCGCDNCRPNINNPLLNIPARLDNWSYFLAQLPYSLQTNQPYKTFWAVPQAFPAQDFWLRVPTADEVIAMTLLAIIHGAKGVVGWQFPTTPEIQTVTTLFAHKVMETGAVKRFGGLGKFVLGDKARQVDIKLPADAPVRWDPHHGWYQDPVEAKAWWVGSEFLVSIVNSGDKDVGRVTFKPQFFEIGAKVRRVKDMPWGNGEPWVVDPKANELVRSGMKAKESFVLVVEFF